jgi:hypothetical protein
VQGERFDVWLHAMNGVASEPHAHALSRVFRIPEALAHQLVAALPRIVTRDATAAQATRVVAALQAMGGTAAAVARPLRPMPVLLVGTPIEVVHDAELAAAPNNPPTDPRATLTLGTLDLREPNSYSWLPPAAPTPTTESTQLVGSPEPNAAPPASDQAPHASPRPRPDEHAVHQIASQSPPAWQVPGLPAASLRDRDDPTAAAHPSTQPSARDTRDVALEPMGALRAGAARTSVSPFAEIAPADAPVESPFVLARNLADWIATAQSVDLLSNADGGPAGLAVDADGGAESRLALPQSNPPPAPRTIMRTPRERSQEPRRRVANAADASHISGALGVASPWTTLPRSWQQTQPESFHRALRAHPATGFALILGGTSAFFLLLYALF